MGLRLRLHIRTRTQPGGSMTVHDHWFGNLLGTYETDEDE